MVITQVVLQIRPESMIERKGGILITFLSAILIISCTSDQDVPIRTVSLFESETVLSHGDLLLSNRSSFNRIVGKDSLLIYDESSKKLVLLSLETKNPIWNLDVILDGPDFFDVPFYDAEIEGGKLFLLSGAYFSVYSLTGKNLYRLGVKDLKGFRSEFMMYEFLLINSDEVLFTKIPYDAIQPNFKSQNTPNLFFIYNITTKETKEVKAFSPKEALLDNKERGYYNDFAFHSLVLSSDSIIFNFRFSSDTHVYNMTTNRQATLATPSKFTQNLREPTLSGTTSKPSEWIKYTYSGPKYSAMEMDSETQYIVRINTEFKTLVNGKKKNKKYLMVLSPSLEVLTEMEINEMIMEPPLISNGKIYLRKTLQSQEDAYEFVTYEIKP